MEEITQERGFLYRLLLLVRRGDRAGDRPRRYELHSMRRCEQPGHAFIGEDRREGARKRVLCVAVTSF